MTSTDNEIRLYDRPTDSISSLSFNSDGSRLLCSAWDSKLRLYDVEKMDPQIAVDFQSHAPLLDAVFESDNYVWSGGLARKITRYNIEQKTEDNIGQHEEAVKCLVKSKERNFIISGRNSNKKYRYVCVITPYGFR